MPHFFLQKDIIELICAMPDDDNIGIATQIEDLKLAVENNTRTSAINHNEIVALRAQNDGLVKQNVAFQAEIGLLKTHAHECCEREKNRVRAPPPAAAHNTTTVDKIREEIDKLNMEINNIQQYLRVNNLEIVGLPEPNENEDDETLILNALNNLEGIEQPIRHEDIDISHPLNSNRKDNKPVHVVRFISRKTKNLILAAMKLEANKQFKFRNKDVYVNEHLSKQNRSLFAKAQEKKRNLGYKHCWTRGGIINLRKTDNSQTIVISSDQDLVNLVQ